MSTRKSEQPPTNPFDVDQPDPFADGGCADPATELVDELEQILRGEAEDSRLPEEEPTPFAAEPPAEPERVSDDLWGDLPSTFALDEPPPGLPEATFDEPDLDAPAAAFWQGERIDRVEEERRPAQPAPLLRRRDIATIAVLLALIAAGATYSALELTGNSDRSGGTAVAEIADGEADEPATPGGEADGPDLTEIARADAGLGAALAAPAADEPAEPENEPEPLAPASPGALAENNAEPEPDPQPEPLLGPQPDPQPDDAAGAEPDAFEPRQVEAVVLESPALAFANPGVGGPLVRDPLDALTNDAEEPAGAAPAQEPPADETPAAPALDVANAPANEPQLEQAEPNAPDPAGADPETTPAIANAYVNMRSGPDNAAAIITVVAEGQEVGVIECNFWCRVIVDGTEGWIYQDFLNR